MGPKRLLLAAAFCAALLTEGASVVRGQTLSSAPYSGVTTSALTANWTSTFGAGTTYYCQISTGAFPNSDLGNASSTTANTFATFTGLASGTSYFLQVSTLPAGGPITSLNSVVTQATITAAGFSNITTSGLTANWTSTFGTGTTYYVQLSSGAFPNSFSGNASSNTFNVLATFSSLSTGVQYFAQISTNAAGPFMSLGSATTLSTITAAAFTTVNFNYLTANWTTSFPAGMAYFVNLSTGAFPNAFTGNQSSNTANAYAVFAGLTGSTQYFAEVSTMPAGPFTVLGSTMTPSSPAVTNAGFTTVNNNYLTANWFSSFSTGTLYYAQLSTGAFPNSFTGNQSSNTLNLDAVFAGLSGATTYYAQVATAAAGPFINLGFTPTLPNPAIIQIAYTGISSFTLTANWATTFSTGTPYFTQLSSGAFPNSFTGNQSSNTFNLNASYAGLTGATTYYVEVATAAAGPFTLFVSTPTLPPPAIFAATFTPVNITSVTANWTTTWPAGTPYYAQISTGAFPNSFTGNQSSTTFNAFAVFTGLTNATTYYAQVSTATTGPFTILGSAVTIPATITPQPFSSVGINSLTANWFSTFPGGITYTVQLSSGPFPNSLGSNQTATTTSLLLNFVGLVASTTYYVQVATAAGPFTFIGAQQTLPTIPTAPGAPVPAALSTTAINWTWTLSPSATSYRVFEDVPSATLIGASTTTFFAQTGLTPNSAHVLQTQGSNASGTGPLSPIPATAYTLANPPTGTSVTAIYATSVTISWLLNSNPAGTTAEVQMSTNDLQFWSIFTGASTSYTQSGLLGCTTYYFGVRDWNFANAATVFDSTIVVRTANTTPAPPSGLSATSLSGNQVALSWTASPTEGVIQYSVYYDAGTGTINYGAPLAVLAAPQTTYTTGVLASTAAYTFAVRATHRCGVTETTGVAAVAGSIAAPAALSAAVKNPGAGAHINGNDVTIAASIISGTVDQVASILYQYRTTGTTAWLTIPAADMNHPNPDMAAPFYIHWNVTVVPAGSYDVRAVATSQAGVMDPTPSAVTLVVDPINPTVTESINLGQVQTLQLVDNAVTNSIAAGGIGANDPLCTVSLPAGALSASTVTLTATPNPTITTAAPAGFSFAGSALQIDLGNRQHQLSNGAVAQITLSYPDTVLFPKTLAIWSLDPATGQWSQDFASIVNTSSRTVTGFTPHFSVFAIIGGSPAAADLSTVRVYPNPYKPNGGNTDQGKPFNLGDPTSGIVFDNLPGVVTITIYTASGRFVTKFDSSNGGGTVHWDTKNQDGRDVASGGYIAVISSPGMKSVVRKIAIIR